MAASTAPAAKAAILTAIATRPALAGITPGWRGPTEGEDIAEELIYLGRTSGTGEWRTLGAGVRHESYLVFLYVDVLKYGDDARGTEERAFVLLDEVSAALTTDKFLGGLLYTPAAIEAWDLVPTPLTEQWHVRLEARIRCEAKFTP